MAALPSVQLLLLLFLEQLIKQIRRIFHYLWAFNFRESHISAANYLNFFQCSFLVWIVAGTWQKSRGNPSETLMAKPTYEGNKGIKYMGPQFCHFRTSGGIRISACRFYWAQKFTDQKLFVRTYYYNLYTGVVVGFLRLKTKQPTEYLSKNQLEVTKASTIHYERLKSIKPIHYKMSTEQNCRKEKRESFIIII